MTKHDPEKFVLGLDLDGCVADFYEQLREFYAEWSGKDIDSLTRNVSYGLPEWGLVDGEYPRLHRYCVTQKNLFEVMKPIPGAAQVLRELSAEGVFIRILTHRLFISHFHAPAANQTIKWLEQNGIFYKELCLIKDKSSVEADLYIEDSEENLIKLEQKGKNVICFSNSTNINFPARQRAYDWKQVGEMVRSHYYSWLNERDFPLPVGPGLPAGEEPIEYDFED